MAVFSKKIMAGETIRTHQFHPKYKRLILPISLLALLATESTRELTVNSLSDAFWAVSTYVAFTLIVYHYVSIFVSSNNKVANLYRTSRHYQVLFAALLGALPGCGGAIVVTTQFVSGRVGFGAVVAVLTATMGDAAFLLLASQPDVGVSLLLMGVVVGWLTGAIVNLAHKDDFLRPKAKPIAGNNANCCKKNSHTSNEKRAINIQGEFWRWIIVPATLIAILGSLQIDTNALFNLPDMSIEWIGSGLIVASMLLWSLTREINDYQSTVSEDNKQLSSHPLQKAAQDTNFITAWVVIGFIAFELCSHFANFEPTKSLLGFGPWMPMLGMLVGLLPGCGPQILITSLYLSGAVPMSAQISNAISNDGDALFPAIALAPQAALVASLYSAIPALILGYSYYWLFE